MQNVYTLSKEELNELNSLEEILLDTSFSIRDNVLDEEEWDEEYSKQWLSKRADLLMKAHDVLHKILTGVPADCGTLTDFELSK